MGLGTVTVVIPLEDAQRMVLEACPPLAPVSAPFRQALGLVLAADVVAAEDVPPFANSAVDGYAVRAADLTDAPVELRVVADTAAGAEPYDQPVQHGEAVRIMTGAPLPAGVDAVAMVEDSERVGDDRVRLARLRGTWRGRQGRRRRRSDRRHGLHRRHGRASSRGRRAGQHQRGDGGRCSRPSGSP